MPIIQVNLEASGRLRQENNEFKTNLLSGTLKKQPNKITNKETKTKGNIAMLSVGTIQVPRVNPSYFVKRKIALFQKKDFLS